jgi:hypothetical protein
MKYQDQQIAGMKLSAPMIFDSIELQVLSICMVKLMMRNPLPKDRPPPLCPHVLGWTANAASHNFAYVSFSVLVFLSVLTMSIPAPCADSAHLPGILRCHAVLLSLLKKSGKVFVTLFPRFPPPWPTPLRRRVFDAIEIATSLMVCFLQR